MPCLNCKECKHVFSSPTFNDADGYESIYGFEWEDYYCSESSVTEKNNGFAREIESYVDKQIEKIVPPNWCPLKDMKTNFYKTYSDRTRALTKAEGMMKNWDDIQIGKIYHFPPLQGEKRCDIIIINKTNTCCTYRKVKGNNTSGSILEYLYKSYENKWKFLVEHRIQDTLVLSGLRNEQVKK